MDIFYWRISIYNQTQATAYKYYPNEACTTAYDRSILHEKLPKTIPMYNDCIIEVVNEDTIDAYVRLQEEEDYKPVLLNMADPSIPGGCVKMGAAAQEENIFRRTNYFMTLNFVQFYPLLDTKTLYSDKVILFRSNEETGYDLLPKPLYMSIIAATSVKHPRLNDSFTAFKDFGDRQLQYDKIRMIFHTAILQKKNHDALVLSAFGCDDCVTTVDSTRRVVFKCPPEEVAQLFKKAIGIYKGYFRKIVFAIKCNDRQNQNYEIFKNVLQSSSVSSKSSKSSESSSSVVSKEVVVTSDDRLDRPYDEPEPE